MALGDDSPASYIRMVHHLIEKCMTFGMSMEECMEALSKRADVQPVVTSTGRPVSNQLLLPLISRNIFICTDAELACLQCGKSWRRRTRSSSTDTTSS
uniref:Uncharacterized protein n=1 Tax=Triticum aestivum TaxID=4565 RepID=A0A3B6IQL9_WHEAT